jgi:SPP1 gp7 family putative phage head morphogenesis protein
MSYWEDRQTSRYMGGEKLINQYYRDLEKAFIQAKKEIQQTIDMFYLRYADENGVTYAKARKLLSKAEIGDLKDFINKAKANMGKFNLEIENMSIKSRITRYEALEKQIETILQSLYAVDYEHNGSLTLGQVYKDSYYKTWYNIDVRTGFHKEFAQISPSLIDTYINYPFDGANFSTRLWKQKTYLQQQITEAMTTMMIQGKHPSTLSKGFAKKFQTKQWEAYRLLHTEASFMMSQATHDVYKEDGVEKYEYIATLDSRTCKICGPLDGKVFETKDAVTGVNVAPMHSLCRCTDAPKYEDTPTGGMTRIARDQDGNNIKVPASMTFTDWKKEYMETQTKE